MNWINDKPSISRPIITSWVSSCCWPRRVHPSASIAQETNCLTLTDCRFSPFFFSWWKRENGTDGRNWMMKSTRWVWWAITAHFSKGRRSSLPECQANRRELNETRRLSNFSTRGKKSSKTNCFTSSTQMFRHFFFRARKKEEIENGLNSPLHYYAKSHQRSGYRLRPYHKHWIGHQILNPSTHPAGI